jgi:hypothetical protein
MGVLFHECGSLTVKNMTEMAERCTYDSVGIAVLAFARKVA